MRYSFLKRLGAVETPPIAAAQAWISKPEPEAHSGVVRPLIDLSQAVPHYTPPPVILDTVAELAQSGAAGLYTDIAGIEPLRAAVAAEMNGATDRTGVENVRVDNVAITAGCNQAFSVVMQALVAAGDEVVMPLPWYFNHRMYLDILGANAVGVPPSSPNSAFPDAAAIAAHITPRTRAILLVSPNNPTGEIYPPTLLTAIDDLARENNIPLVVDETYRDFIVDEQDRHKLFENKEWSSSFIQLYSFSKSFAMTGYRVGSIVAAAPFIEQVTKILDCQTICAPAISQRAALAGLEHGDSFRSDKRALMASRLAALRAAFTQAQLDFKLCHAGAYFAYIQHPFSAQAGAIAEEIASKYNLITLPGSMFGPGQEAYLRIAFANVASESFDDVIERLAAACDSLDKNFSRR